MERKSLFGDVLIGLERNSIGTARGFREKLESFHRYQKTWASSNSTQRDKPLSTSLESQDDPTNRYW